AALAGTTVAGASFSGTAIPTGLDAAGVILCGGATLSAERTSITAVDAPALSTSSSIGSLVAVAGSDVDVVRIQRSLLESIAGNYEWRALGGRLGGLQVTA